VNFLIAIISPNSNPEESALPKGLIRFDHSIEIWLAEVARVSRPFVLVKMNDFAKRKVGPRNVVQLVGRSWRLVCGRVWLALTLTLFFGWLLLAMRLQRPPRVAVSERPASERGPSWRTKGARAR
jgi:hypothetical protein